MSDYTELGERLGMLRLPGESDEDFAVRIDAMFPSDPSDPKPKPVVYHKEMSNEDFARAIAWRRRKQGLV